MKKFSESLKNFGAREELTGDNRWERHDNGVRVDAVRCARILGFSAVFW
jgi:hypothetical protein